MIDNKKIACRCTSRESSFAKSFILLCVPLLMFAVEPLFAQVISNSGGGVISISSGAVVVTDVVENNTGSTIDNNGTLTAATITNAGTMQGDGLYTVSSVFTNTGTFTAGSSTVDFNGGGAQIVPALNYNNLTFSTAGVKTFAAGTSGIAGTFSITGTAASDATSNATIVDYNGGGAQTILAINYTGLTLSNAGLKTFSAGTTGIAGDFTVSGATADATTNTTTINFDGPGSQAVAAINYYALTFSNAGTKTLSAGTTGVANLFTVTGSAVADATTNSTTVEYTGAILQTSPVMTYYNLSVNKTGSRAVLNNVVVNNNLNILLGQARVTNQDITVLGTTTIDGTFVVAQIAGTKILGDVVVNTGGVINFIANSDLTINGNLQVDGTGSITSGTGTWAFQKAGGGGILSGSAAAPAITNPVFTTNYSHTGNFVFGNLTVSGTTLTNNGSLTVDTSLAGSGTLNQGSGATLTLNFSGLPTVSTFNAAASGNTVQYSFAGAQTIFATDYDNLTLTTSGVKTFPSGTTRIAGALTFGGTATGDAATNGSTIEYNGSGAQNIAVADYTNLTLSTSGVKSFGSGTTRIAGTMSVTGTATADAVTNTPTVEYNGSSIQSSAGITYYNLTINNAAGVSLGGATTVNNTLTLTSGVVTTGANTLQIGASGSVSRTSGHIVGNLAKDVPTGSPSITFEVGDASNYTPVTTAFTNVTVSGALTVSNTSGDHPQILTSGIEASLSVNRYWTLSGSITYTSYDITMNFQAGDVDGGANTASFIIGRYNSGWTLPTVGTLTSSSSQATGVTAFGDFQIGEVSIYSLKTWDGGAATTNWGDANNWNPNGVPSSSNNVDLTGAVTIDINTAASVNSITLNNASLVVTILSGNSLTAAGDLSLASGTLNTAASFPAVTGTVNISGGTVGYTNTGAQTISAQTYNHLTLSGSGVKTFSSGTTSLKGDLTFGGTATADATTNTTTIDYTGGGSQVVGALDYYNLTLSNAGTKTFAAGTSRIANTFSIGGTASADAATNSATIEYNGSGAQTVNAINYHHLTLAVSGTKTFASGTIGIAGDLTVTGTAAADATTNSTTITYNGSGAQNVGAIDYYNLTLAVSGTKTFASGTTNVAGDLTLTGTASADAVTNSTTIAYNGSGAQNVAAVNYYNLTLAVSGTKTFAAGTTGIASTLSITGTAAADATSNTTTIDYNGAGTQSIALMTYNNLSLSTSGAKQFTAGTTSLQGNITVSGSASLDASTNSTTIDFSGPGSQTVAAGAYYNLTFSNAGTKTLGSGTTQISGIFSITGSAAPDVTTNSTTIEFNGTANQDAPAITYYNFIANNSGTRLLIANTVVNNDFTAQAGQTRVAGSSFSVAGTTTLNAEFRITATGGSKTLGNIVINSSGNLNFVAAEDLTINGDLTVNGSGSVTSSTGLWTFQKPGGGTFGGTSTGVTIANASITTAYSNSGTFSFTDLAVSGATLTNNGTVNVSNTLSGTGTFTQGAGSTLNYSSLSAMSVSGFVASATNNTVNYSAAGSQTIVVADYTDLTLSTSGVKSFGSGTTRIAGTMSVTGTATADAVTNTPTVEYNGSSIQSSAGITYYNLTINNAAGVSLGGATTVNNTLTLTSGVVTTGANTLQIGASGSVSRTSGHIVGNLAKDVPTGSPSITFEVGDAGNYTPVTTAFTNVTVSGALTVSSTSGDHPQILTSGIEASLSVNRYWTLSGSITYTSYDITMNFQAGDVDGGANTASFIIGRYNSGWTLPTVGTLTSSSSQATGVTAFGDFQIGEVSIYSLKTWDGGAATTNWGDANNWNPNGVPSSSNNVDLTGAVTIDINTAASVNSITLNNASLVVTILSGNSLTAAGDLSLASGTLNTAASFPAVTGTVNISGGTVGYTNTGAQTISAQTYNHLTLSGSGVKTFSSGTTSLTGDLTFGGTATGDATTNTTTIDYNGGGSQIVGALDYYNLTLSNAGTKTFAAGTSRIANTFSIGGTASADAATNSTTIEYNGSGAQTVNAINYHHLTLAVSGTKTFASGTTGIAGDLTVTGTAAADATTNSTTITYNGSGSQNVGAIDYYNLTLAVSGTKTFASGTTNVAGDLTLTGTAAADATTNSTTIAYNGSGSQNVAAVNYYNLTLAVSGTKTFAAGTTGIASVLSISGTAAADILANSTTLDYNGSAQSVPALDYFNLTLSNTGTKILAAGTTTLKSNLTISGTASLDATTNTTVVEFYGTTTQTSSPAAFYDLVINKVSNRLVVNDLTVNNNFTITTGEGRLTAGAFTVLGTTTVTELFTVSNAAATPTFGNIIINSTGTVTFSAAAVATVNGNLQVDGSATLTSGTGLWTFQKPGGGTIGGTAASISITNAAFTTDYAVSADMIIGGLTVTGATVTNNAAITLNTSFAGTGTFTQGSGSTLSIAFDGSSTISILNASASNNLVQYNSTGVQNIVVANYDNLTLGNAGTKTFGSGSTGIAGTLSITGTAVGDATTNSSTIDYNSGGGQTITLLPYHHLTASNAGTKTIPSGTLQLAGNFQVTGSAVVDAITNSTTVEFMGSASQAIPAVNFYNLTSSSSGARVLASSGSIGIAAVFTVGTNAYTNTGSTIEFNGAGSQTIPVFNFNNISFSGNRSGGVITLAPGTITVAGNGTSTASNLTYTAAGNTVAYNGTSAQTVAGITYGVLTFSNAGAKTLSESAAVTNDMIVNSTADVSVDASGVLTVNGNLINDGILTNDGSITLP